MYKKEKQNMPKRKNVEMALHPKPCDDDDNHIASDDGHSTDEEDDDDNHTTSDEEDDNADDADDLEQMTDAVWKVSNDMVRLARKSDKHRLYRPDEYITRGRIIDMFVMQKGRCGRFSVSHWFVCHKALRIAQDLRAVQEASKLFTLSDVLPSSLNNSERSI